MLYKVSGNMHPWDWSEFKKEINGRVVENCAGDIDIYWIVYEVEHEIDESILDKYILKAERVR